LEAGLIVLVRARRFDGKNVWAQTFQLPRTLDFVCLSQHGLLVSGPTSTQEKKGLVSHLFLENWDYLLPSRLPHERPEKNYDTGQADSGKASLLGSLPRSAAV